MIKTSKSLANKFRSTAERLIEKIEHLRRPMTQNSTPKRQKEYSSRIIDADNLDRCRLALLALASAWDKGEVPYVLEGVKTKNEVFGFVRHGTESRGYYSIYSTHKYVDQTEAGKAIQSMLEKYIGENDADRQEAIKKERQISRLIDKVRFADIPSFFPTPLSVINLMLKGAGISPGMKVLEPSAGIGSIVDEISKIVGEGNITAVEKVQCLVDVLNTKGNCKVVCDDFLTVDGLGLFDRIVMNPPFENMQDISHVMRAWEMLSSDGILVSIMSASPFFRSNTAAETFRNFLEANYATVVDLPQDSFKGGGVFRTTGVSCKMIVLRK
jgi:hypothetical protein